MLQVDEEAADMRIELPRWVDRPVVGRVLLPILAGAIIASITAIIFWLAEKYA